MLCPKYLYLSVYQKMILGSRKEGVEEDQSFASPKCVFWDIDFKLVIKKQKVQKEPLILLLSSLRESDRKACFRKQVLYCHLRIRQEDSTQGPGS